MQLGEKRTKINGNAKRAGLLLGLKNMGFLLQMDCENRKQLGCKIGLESSPA